jgi:uncharacterized protein (DUF58 family)
MVHCYPDLRRDRRQLALSTRTVQLGAFASAFAGRGRSFDRLRDYVVGDVLDDIHWRATAKRRRPITKLFQVERAQRVYVAVDMSRLSARPSPQQIPAEDLPLPLLERYINAALVLGSVAQAHGDYFGLVGFSDGIDQFAPAARGIAHYRACREAILEFGTRRVNADYRELFTFLATRVRRRSLVIVLTSVDDPALSEELVQCIQLVAERHVVVAAAVRPPGARPLYPARPVRVAAEVNDRLAGHLLHKRLQTTARQLSRHGVHFLTLEHADMVTSLVSSYRKLKRKQLV